MIHSFRQLSLGSYQTFLPYTHHRNGVRWTHESGIDREDEHSGKESKVWRYDARMTTNTVMSK
jgi:hypothetical protein